MTLTRTGAKVAALGAAAALVLAACGGGDDGGGGQSQAPTGTKGGTLNVLMIADFEHLDPQRSYVSSALNFGVRLLTRTLTAYKSVEGPAGSEILPDLAEDLGTGSNDNKTWTFKLRQGLKYEDGSPITCEDIKYGVERSFSDQITAGPQYAKQYLAGNASTYKGPYVDPAGLDSIKCDGDKSITFELNRSLGDFNYTVSMPTFSPVPKAKDTNIKYDDRPFSSGPYKIESYVRDKSLVLVRNENWDPKTDPIRKAYPDKIVATFGLDAIVIDQRIQQDSGEDQTAIQLDTQIQGENTDAFLNDATLKPRIVSGLDGFTRYLAINTTKVKDVNVRKAIQLAINKETYRAARGGDQAGDYATSMITTALKSHKAFKDRDTDNPQGDPAKAAALLGGAAAKSIALKIDFANSGSGPKAAAAFKEALERVPAFAVTLNPINPDVYYDTVGKTATQNELTLAGWGPDWPSGSSVIPPLFDGKQIVPEGNQNFAQLNDPDVQAALEAANKETDLTKQAKLWGDLDEMITVDKAAYVPLIWGKTNAISGSKVKGIYLHAFYGELDMAALSVA